MRADLHCGARASDCSGFSRGGAQAAGPWVSGVAERGLRNCGSQALEHRLSGCGPWGLVDWLLNVVGTVCPVLKAGDSLLGMKGK